MYSKAELEAKAHIELINIAKELGIARSSRFTAQDLIYKIIALQSENPQALTKEQEAQKKTKAPATPRPKRARIKPMPVAESSMNNPSLHKRANRPAAEQPAAKSTLVTSKDLTSPVALDSSSISIPDFVLPEVPTIPDVVSPSGRLIRRKDDAPATEAAPAVVPEAAAPAQPVKRRGRPKKVVSKAAAEPAPDPEQEAAAQAQPEQPAAPAEPAPAKPQTKTRRRTKVKADAPAAESVPQPEASVPQADNAPTGRLAEAIARDFGSFEAFKEAFAKAGATLFGSGWAWLSADNEGNLKITQESNASNPILHGLKPLLTMEVWEHA